MPILVLTFAFAQMIAYWGVAAGLVAFQGAREDARTDLIIHSVLPALLLPVFVGILFAVHGREAEAMVVWGFPIACAIVTQVIRVRYLSRAYSSASALLWFALFGFIGGGIVWLDGLTYVETCLREADLLVSPERPMAIIECKNDAVRVFDIIADSLNFVIPTFAAFVGLVYFVSDRMWPYPVKKAERHAMVLAGVVALISILIEVGVWVVFPTQDLIEQANGLLTSRT